MTSLLWSLFALIVPAPAGDAPASATPAAPGSLGGQGLALLASKALTVPPEGPQFVNDAVLLVRDGKIEAVGSAREVAVPADYEVRDVGENWLMPGLVDLHAHIAGQSFMVNDINDMVFLTNPELRASSAVVPENPNLLRGVAGGVTTVLFIPGSGTNMGGQGVLLKTALDTYEEMEIRNPGSLKLAQAGNPERWLIGPGRSFMNWNTRNTFLRGLAYAKRWQAYEKGEGEKPEKDLQFEVFRDLLEKKTQVSTHTQIYQVVLMTIEMVRRDFGLDVYIDHGSFDGWKVAGLAEEAGVPAILGPREISRHYTNFNDTDGKILGMASQYQKAGHTMIGFNTDSPIVPEEELSLQAAMGVRYGMDNSRLEHVRGLTIVPAITAGIEDRVGSLEPGKDADVLVVSGDPADPRTSVESVYIEGQHVYDAALERRW